jgi:hypothetical protein
MEASLLCSRGLRELRIAAMFAVELLGVTTVHICRLFVHNATEVTPRWHHGMPTLDVWYRMDIALWVMVRGRNTEIFRVHP